LWAKLQKPPFKESDLIVGNKRFENALMVLFFFCVFFQGFRELQGKEVAGVVFLSLSV
jgi:hypothetical protein